MTTHVNRFTFIIFATFLLSCFDNSSNTNSSTRQTEHVSLLSYSVGKVIPHDTSLFTEGLEFHDNTLYESTGSPDDLPLSKSLIGITHLETGIFETKIEMDKTRYFGEGITIMNNRIFQLTYKNQTGFVYDLKSFKKLDSFHYSNIEGWGLTNDGQVLIMSDGTDVLTYLDPIILKEQKKLQITMDGTPCTHLNELEFVDGFLYANIWLTNLIVKIDTASGKVIGKVDLTSLATDAQNKNKKADVLNGIAYNPQAKKMYVTGKLWPNIYEIFIY